MERVAEIGIASIICSIPDHPDKLDMGRAGHTAAGKFSRRAAVTVISNIQLLLSVYRRVRCRKILGTITTPVTCW